jgi:hypothetical protein
MQQLLHTGPRRVSGFSFCCGKKIWNAIRKTDQSQGSTKKKTQADINDTRSVAAAKIYRRIWYRKREIMMKNATGIFIKGQK